VAGSKRQDGAFSSFLWNRCELKVLFIIEAPFVWALPAQRTRPAQLTGPGASLAAHRHLRGRRHVQSRDFSGGPEFDDVELRQRIEKHLNKLVITLKGK